MAERSSGLENAIARLIEEIQNSTTYMDYKNALNAVEEEPGLMEKINRFRAENFEMQQRYEGDELMDRMEAFERANEQFRANPRVDRFLAKELACVRMFQNILQEISEAIEFR